MQTTKTCTNCGETKSLDGFSKDRNKKDGKQVTCKICAAAKTRRYYRERGYKTAAIHRTTERKAKLKATMDAVKQVNGCALCPEQEVCALDFHHLDPAEKETEVSKFVTRHNGPKMVEEMRKCVVVCKNCHSKIHAELLEVSNEQLCVIPEMFVSWISPGEV